jgi:hypothetical protein
VLGDILAGSRVLQQRILERVRRVELQIGVEPSHYEPGAKDTGQRKTTGADAAAATGGEPSGEPGEHDAVRAEPGNGREWDVDPSRERAER